MQTVKAKPFIKWVGGKTQLLPEIREKYPDRIDKYCEPFVGGGAVLFDILQTFSPKEVLINDINPELINLYMQISLKCDELIDELQILQTEYLSKPEEMRKDLYYSKRNKYNEYILSNDKSNDLNKAALFIYLNKTCFNGLYRVNSKGLFNVPYNGAKNPLICDVDNIKACSKLLRNVQMHVGDYTYCRDFIDSKTFVYIDPPYRPLSETSAFLSYNEKGFDDLKQVELGRFIREINEKGAMIVASNSDPKNSNAEDNFFDDLYSSFTVERIHANRMINSDVKKRGAINEILISNFIKKGDVKYGD